MRTIALAATMLATACGGQAGTSQPPRRGQPLLLRSPATAFLPRHVPLVIVTTNALELDEKLASLALAAAFYDGASASAAKMAGIDLDAPTGIALVDAKNHTWVLFARIADRTALLRGLAAAARARGVELKESRAQGNTVLIPSGKSGVAAVLRENQLVLLVTKGPPSVRDLAVMRIATTESEDSLAESGSFQRASRAAPPNALIAAYISAGRLTRAAASPNAEELRLLSAIESSQNRIREARSRGAPRAEIESMTRQLGLLQAVAAMHQRSSELTARVFGPLGVITAAVTLNGGTVELAVQLTPTAGSMPARLLPSSGRAPLSASIEQIDANAALLLEGAIDPSAAIELLDMWLASDVLAKDSAVSKLDTLRIAGRRVLGVDIDRALLRNLSGQLGVAVLEPASEIEAPGIAIAAQLRDIDAARQLLRGVATAKVLAGMVRVHAPGERVSIVWPQAPPLHLAIVGGYFLATSNEPLIAAFAGALETSSSHGVLIVGAGTPRLLKPKPASSPTQVALRPDSDPTPLSPRVRELRSELDKQWLALEAARARIKTSQARQHRRIETMLGAVRLELRSTPTGIQAKGQLDTSHRPAREFVLSLADALRHLRRLSDRQTAEVNDLKARYRLLADTLRAARAADIDAARQSNPDARTP